LSEVKEEFKAFQGRQNIGFQGPGNWGKKKLGPFRWNSERPKTAPFLDNTRRKAGTYLKNHEVWDSKVHLDEKQKGSYIKPLVSRRAQKAFSRGAPVVTNEPRDRKGKGSIGLTEIRGKKLEGFQSVWGGGGGGGGGVWFTEGLEIIE